MHCNPTWKNFFQEYQDFQRSECALWLRGYGLTKPEAEALLGETLVEIYRVWPVVAGDPFFRFLCLLQRKLVNYKRDREADSARSITATERKRENSASFLA